MKSITDEPKRWSYTPPSDAIWRQLRAADVTSTESAALFQASPYLTEFELYWRKRAKAIVEPPWSERMRWGARLQDVVARGIAEDEGIKVRKLNQYMRLVSSRMGSSFDFEVVGLIDGMPETPLREAYRELGVGNFEIKCVDYRIFRNYWFSHDDDPSLIEAPAHIEIQVQHQLHVSGRPWSAIGVLIGGNTPRILIRGRDLEVGQAIEERVQELFARIKTGNPPDPTFPNDAELVCKLHDRVIPGRMYDGRHDNDLRDLCEQYHMAAATERVAKEDKEVAKAKILERIGEAERALVSGFNLSAFCTKPADVPAYTRPGYRMLRVTAKNSAVA